MTLCTNHSRDSFCVQIMVTNPDLGPYSSREDLTSYFSPPVFPQPLRWLTITHNDSTNHHILSLSYTEFIIAGVDSLPMEKIISVILDK